MSDPIRLLDDPSFGGSLSNGSDARSLLELGRDVAPPAEAQAKVWSGLQAAVGAAAGAAALATPSTTAAAPEIASQSAPATTPVSAPAAGKTGAALGTKLGLVGVVVGAALIATTLLRTPSSTLSETPPAASFAQGGQSSDSGDPHVQSGFKSHMGTNAAPVAPKEAQAKDPEPEGPPTSAPRASTPATPSAPAEAAEPAPDRVSQLQDEAAAVQEARSQLAANNASGALQTLSKLDADVPRGILGQERTVLTIEALKKSGQGAAAAQRAAAFIEANPKSPYAERLRAYLQ